MAGFETSEALAARLGAAMARWSLDAAMPVAETATSWVLRATSDRGAHALKLLKPYGHDEINGARLMQWWAGDGAARIDAIDGHDVLMEWLQGGTLGDVVRADEARDAEATGVLCDIVESLHRARPAPLPELWRLEDWMTPLCDSDLAFLPPEVRPLWQRAQGILADLLATTTGHRPLHGDLHHDNVIGSDGGWRVIDPKGLLGDPVFDVANIFRNPYGGGEMVFRPERIERLATTFGARFGWERERILGWACALTAISAVWNKDTSFEWEMRMLPVLMAAVDRS
jgi:streptomycin 6-kinase